MKSAKHNSKQSKSVSPKKDTMAANVGGSSHMDAGGSPSSKYVKGSGGKSKKK